MFQRKACWNLISSVDRLYQLSFHQSDKSSLTFFCSSQAKLRASLAWLLSKVYGADVPKEMHDPFYETSQVGGQCFYFVSFYLARMLRCPLARELLHFLHEVCGT